VSNKSFFDVTKLKTSVSDIFNLITHKLAKQFFSLASIQSINLLFPLFVIPYVSRILGPENLGLVNFATSFLTYFTLIINYGFDYSATREISVVREDKDKVSDIFNEIVNGKILLFILSSVIYFVIILSSQKYSDHIFLYYCSYISLISSIFYSTWLFQGMQKLPLFTIVNLIFRIASILLIFLIVKNASDYSLFQLINGGTVLITAITTLILAWFKFGIRFKFIPVLKTIEKIKTNFLLFISIVIVNFNTTSTIVLLGYLTDYETVGYYTASMKVYSVIASLSLFPIAQVMYPHLATKFNESAAAGLSTVRKFIPRILLLFSIVSIGLIFSSKLIINILYGEKFESSILILQILAPLLIISTLVNILCYQVMLNLKMDKHFLGINAIGFVMNILMTILLVPRFKAYGTCISLYMIEFTIVVVSLIILRKNNYKVF
jgi:O-antigen/teichoic acid export membrane protein